ncbi:endonuclease YncB(thermonuclease family) [Natranaerovirga hydrolytica]|uniref:Endonuclease YncB(Thermonuclease family) n=1 Tax=Natranaerovirga hydrolytica TaxID=680378 RepID=A0A4R1MXZ7_9FIRM|nr:type II secretion system protein GspK [Natranaerovirga hydrolytica]TCK98147.1 endonuclease YncB(thermonuclease family) [Natranaerovirga hydrolytica]
MKKIISIILILVFITGSINVYANYSVDFSNDSVTVARVIEIIDGEAYRVIDNLNRDNEEEKIIRLIGVNTQASTEAFDKAQNDLLGKNVIIQRDSNYSIKDQYNYELVYLYLDYQKPYNVHLLEEGYAVISDDHSESEHHTYIVRAQDYAKNHKIGLWSDTDRSTNEHRVNINTATATVLHDLLEDTSLSQARRIVNSRNVTPYYTIEDIKFADSSLSHEWYDKNRDKLSVVTHLNTASDYELSTLFPSSVNQSVYAQRLIDYRLFNTIDAVEDLDTLDFRRAYEHFEKYVTVDGLERSLVNENVVNINTATVDEILEVSSLNRSTARSIVNKRNEDGYIYKNLYELVPVNNGLNNTTLRDEIRNFTAITNINTASDMELRSLFSITNMNDSTKEQYIQLIHMMRPFYEVDDLRQMMSSSLFNTISPYVSVTNESPEARININLVDKDDVIDYLGLTRSEASDFTRRNYLTYRNANNVSFEPEKYNTLFSFYTNINTASTEELYLLHDRMNRDLVDAIVEFREDQPFSSIDEVEYVFRENSGTTIFRSIREFIVFY